MKRILITSLVLVLMALGSLAYPHASGSGGAAGQKQGSRRPAARPTIRQARIDYSKFLHTTPKHQGACNTCHKVPTSNWRKVRDYPDIADYPGHEACVSCHRPQFFKGAKPVLCSVCHSKVSPKDDVRFAFRNPASRRQFMIEFPHGKHQDVIAMLLRQFPVREQPEFVRASFRLLPVNADETAKHYNNCEICHGPRNTPSAAPAAGWIDGFVPDNLTLKSVPVNHASCFGCHWKSEQPVNENCAGCHKVPGPPALVAVADSPKRISLKFRHGREQHIQECTTCHINITKATSLKGLKPDVPITSCATSSCHNNPSGHQEVAKELAGIQKDKQFICSYCHTSDVGRRDAPAGHYWSTEQRPSLRKDIK